MENVKKTYTAFHEKQNKVHTYPTEWVIRTMLGTYPNLKIDKKNYQEKNNEKKNNEKAKILDLGFGDARNMPLLHNIGLDIYGVEITEEIIELTEAKLNDLKIPATLKVGSNTKIPFDDNFFDLILASSSCYYVDSSCSFEDNMKELLRVLKKNGIFIANFPEKSKSFICQTGIETEDGHLIIQNDPYGLRNGYKFKVFESQDQLKNYFSGDFFNISTGYGLEDYYGVTISQFYLVAYKK